MGCACRELEGTLAWLEVLEDTAALQARRLDGRFGLALLREQKVAAIHDAKGSLSPSLFSSAEVGVFSGAGGDGSDGGGGEGAEEGQRRPRGGRCLRRRLPARPGPLPVRRPHRQSVALASVLPSLAVVVL